MAIKTGVIGISKNGKYLVEHKGLGHLGTRTEYTLTDDIDNATFFLAIPKNLPFQITSVPAWVERKVRIGIEEKI